MCLTYLVAFLNYQTKLRTVTMERSRSPKFQVVLCKRDKFGKKTDEKIAFNTNDANWLGGRVEYESLRGVSTGRRAKAREELFQCPAVE